MGYPNFLEYFRSTPIYSELLPEVQNEWSGVNYSTPGALWNSETNVPSVDMQAYKCVNGTL